MKAPEEVFSPKATRRVPGVKTPVAAPSCAWELARFPSCCSVLPFADGNCAALGRSAACRFAAGCVPVVDVVALVTGWVLAAVLWLALEPQPVSATVSAIPATATRMWVYVIGLLI